MNFVASHQEPENLHMKSTKGMNEKMMRASSGALEPVAIACRSRIGGFDVIGGGYGRAKGSKIPELGFPLLEQCRRG